MSRHLWCEEWTNEDNMLSRSEGWVLFHVIQRIDNPVNWDGCSFDEPIFANDGEAVRHVAAGTTPTHKKALRLASVFVLTQEHL